MARVRSEDTAPEVKFRKALWAAGVRYRLHDSRLPGKPDIVVPKARLVIFIDGDYWHGNQYQRRGHASLEDQFVASPRGKYWVGKISGNMRRDREHTARLVAEGWQTLRLWESDIAVGLEECVDKTLQVISGETTPQNAGRLPEQTVAEFFAGIGLMRWALEKRGWRVAFANDIDPAKYEMYKANFPEDGKAFCLGDIHSDVNVDEIPDITLATASFPCNDLSLAGARRGLAGEHSGAFWGFIQVMEKMGARRPPMILLENVPGWLSAHHGKDFHDSLLALNRLGYKCDAFMVDAARFVPQSRLRLFVVGVAQGYEWPPASGTAQTKESALRPRRLSEFTWVHEDVNWYIRQLPELPRRHTFLKDIVEDIPHDSPLWWSPQRSDYFLSQMSERHTEIARELIYGSEYTYSTAFRRVRYGKSMAELRNDGVAGCLRTPRGGSGRQILLKAGLGEYHVRLLTPRECARLQGVDDSFTIDVPPNQALFGFGDAVCVPAIEWIADHYLNPLVTSAIHGTVLYKTGTGG